MITAHMFRSVALVWAEPPCRGLLSQPSPVRGGCEGNHHKNLFSSHCIQCHGKEGKVKGKVDLSKYSSGGDLRDDPNSCKRFLMP